MDVLLRVHHENLFTEIFKYPETQFPPKHSLITFISHLWGLLLCFSRFYSIIPLTVVLNYKMCTTLIFRFGWTIKEIIEYTISVNIILYLLKIQPLSSFIYIRRTTILDVIFLKKINENGHRLCRSLTLKTE